MDLKRKLCEKQKSETVYIESKVFEFLKPLHQPRKVKEGKLNFSNFKRARRVQFSPVFQKQSFAAFLVTLASRSDPYIINSSLKKL